MVTTYTAQQQVSLLPEETLTSTSAGVVVKLRAQLKHQHVHDSRALMQQISAYINDAYKGKATIFVFEEAFGVKQCLHLMFHLNTLQDYHDIMHADLQAGRLAEVATQNTPKSALNWSDIFADGSMQATVMLPQFRRMYGANDDGTEVKFDKPLKGLPGAFNQFTLPLDEIIHSGNAGLMIHREAQLKYEFRSEGRQFARDVVDSINTKGRGEATAFLYEEAFGSADKIHWLIHMKTVNSYYPLIQMHAADPEVRELYFKDTLPAEKGGGNWSRMFIEGSMVDEAFAPQNWTYNR